MRHVATAETCGYGIRAPIAKPVTARSGDPSARGTGMTAQKTRAQPTITSAAPEMPAEHGEGEMGGRLP
jgi:hypothetical protein